MLLDGAQGFGGSGIAGKDDERAALAEHISNGIESIVVDAIEGTCTVRRTRIVAEVEIIVLG